MVTEQLCCYQKACHVSEPQENIKRTLPWYVARSPTTAQVNEPCSPLCQLERAAPTGATGESLLLHRAEKERHTIITWRWDVPQ